MLQEGLVERVEKIRILQKLIERRSKNREGSIQNQLDHSNQTTVLKTYSRAIVWRNSKIYAASFESPGATKIH